MRQHYLRRAEPDRAAEQILGCKGNSLGLSQSDCLVIQEPPCDVGKQGKHLLMLEPGEVGNYEAKKTRIAWIERMAGNVLTNPGVE